MLEGFAGPCHSSYWGLTPAGWAPQQRWRCGWGWARTREGNRVDRGALLRGSADCDFESATSTTCIAGSGNTSCDRFFAEPQGARQYRCRTSGASDSSLLSPRPDLELRRPRPCWRGPQNEGSSSAHRTRPLSATAASPSLFSPLDPDPRPRRLEPHHLASLLCPLLSLTVRKPGPLTALSTTHESGTTPGSLPFLFAFSQRSAPDPVSLMFFLRLLISLLLLLLYDTSSSSPLFYYVSLTQSLLDISPSISTPPPLFD